MSKLFAVLVTFLFALIAAAPAPASQGDHAAQRVTGRIQEATGYGSGECRFEAHRVAMMMTKQSSVFNGIVGHSFEVDPETVGGSFVLRPRHEVPRDTDLAIAFYESLGDMTNPLATPDRVVIDDERGPLTVERGRVPRGFPLAVVCLYFAETPADFVYSARNRR